MEENKTTQLDAQIRADQIHAFQQELNILKTQQVLSLDDNQQHQVQAYHQQLLARFKTQFDIDHNKASKQLGLGMKIASLVGALAMASSVFFLFFQFWGEFTTTTQVIALVTTSIATFVATCVIAKRDTSGYYTKIIGLISLACFVLNIYMYGQMFNITPSPNAFFVWALYGFMLAYLCKARVLLVASILSLTGFLSMYFGTWSGIYFINFSEQPENILMASVFIFCMPFVVNKLASINGFYTLNLFTHFDKVYRVMGLILFFMPILVLSNWGQGSYITADPDIIEGVYQILGFVAAGLTIYLGIRKQWRHVNITGNIFFILFLYTKFFDWWWEWLPKYLFFFVVGALSIALLLILKRLRLNQNDENTNRHIDENNNQQHKLAKGDVL
ncbi:MAG: hypothetical protein ACJAVV_002951 [Alphaproteobacteria bacterium]|jgi:hypothetical protein